MFFPSYSRFSDIFYDFEHLVFYWKYFRGDPTLRLKLRHRTKSPNLERTVLIETEKIFETKMIIRTFIKSYLFYLISWNTVNAGVVKNSVEKRDVGENQKWAQK